MLELIFLHHFETWLLWSDFCDLMIEICFGNLQTDPDQTWLPDFLQWCWREPFVWSIRKQVWNLSSSPSRTGLLISENLKVWWILITGWMLYFPSHCSPILFQHWVAKPKFCHCDKTVSRILFRNNDQLCEEEKLTIETKKGNVCSSILRKNLKLSKWVQNEPHSCQGKQKQNSFGSMNYKLVLSNYTKQSWEPAAVTLLLLNWSEEQLLERHKLQTTAH